MKRRNFFKNLFAAAIGIFAVSKKTAKAQEKPQTTLRFNENRIEAWTGKKWVNVITVDVLDVVFPWDEPGGLLITVSEPGLTHLSQHDSAEGLTFSSPTAEQRLKLNNDIGEISPYPVVKERLLPRDKCMEEIRKQLRRGEIPFTKPRNPV